MANGGTTDTRNWDRAHSDIEVVKQRMTSLEASFAGFGTQLQDIGKRLDTKPTDVWKVIGGVVTIISLVGGFLLIGKQPYDEGLMRHNQEITRLMETAVSKEDFRTSLDQQQRRNLEGDAERAKLKDELELSRITMARLEGAVTERHADYIRDHADLKARVDSIDSNLIKRPEIGTIAEGLSDRIKSGNESANDRITSVIQSLNELRHDFGTNFTLGDAVKELQLRMNNLTPPPPAQQAVPTK